MIPKTIHLCWLSGDPYPETIARCIASWKEHLPDYEVMLWDRERFDIDSTLWTKQAFAAKKYAFAADYIRLYALYHYGGIYMDSDVLVYKSFDDLLHLPYFIGEDYVGCFEPAIIGAEKHNPWIKAVLDHYDGREFAKPDGSLDMKSLPLVFRDRLCGKYTFRKINDAREFSVSGDEICIFNYKFFNSRDYVGAVRYEKSYCSHNFIGSWYKEGDTIKDKLKAIVPRPISNLMYHLHYMLYAKSMISGRKIPFQ